MNKSDLISGVSHWLGQVKQASSMGMGMQIELTHDKSQVENTDKVTAEISEKSTELSAPKVSTNTDTDELFTEVLLDEAVFDELLSAVGEASLAKMMQVFYHETIMRVNTLKALTPQGSRHDIETEVHTIKSSAGSFGAKTLADVAVRLEAASRTEDEPLDALFNEILPLLNRV